MSDVEAHKKAQEVLNAWSEDIKLIMKQHRLRMDKIEATERRNYRILWRFVVLALFAPFAWRICQ